MEEQEIVVGVEEQEIAEPDTTEETVETGEVVTETAETENTRTEEDSRFANVRRKAEEEARTRVTRNVDAEFKRLFGTYTNPVTGKPIEGYQDYIAAVEAQQKQQREEELRSKGIDPGIIEQAINNSPVVRQAELIMQQNAQSEAQRRYEADLKVVSEIDPSIKNEADLIAHPSYQQVVELVSKNGLSLPDAYKLANYATLASKKTEAVKQAAINQAKAKNHLEQSGSGVSNNSTEVEIPQSELATWKAVYPNVPYEELRKKYNRTL